MPQSKPVITEIKNYYRVGEILKGNCSAQYSKPATNLTWLVNDKPVRKKKLKIFNQEKNEIQRHKDRFMHLFILFILFLFFL